MVACQALLSMEFSKWEYWSGLLSFSRGSSQPRDQTQVFCIAGRFFTVWDTREISLFSWVPGCVLLPSQSYQSVRNLHLTSRKRQGQMPVIKQRQIRLCLCSPMSGLDSEASLWVLADKRWVFHRTVPLHAIRPMKRKICGRVHLQCLLGTQGLCEPAPVHLSLLLSYHCLWWSSGSTRFILNYSCALGS